MPVVTASMLLPLMHGLPRLAVMMNISSPLAERFSSTMVTNLAAAPLPPILLRKSVSTCGLVSAAYSVVEQRSVDSMAMRNFFMAVLFVNLVAKIYLISHNKDRTTYILFL